MPLSNLNLLATAPGGVARLRELIFTLAVQGKLLSQDPKDEPASALLKKIRVEKDRLILDGKIKRDKPLAEIADKEKPFEVPKGWEWVHLGDLVNASEAGWSPTCIGSPRRQDHWGVLKVSAVSWGRFDASANKELPSDLSPRPEYEVKDGDFLLSRANTEELVARSVVVGKAEPKLMLSDKIIRLDVSCHVSRLFLNLCNNASHSRMHYAANASGTSSSMKNVSREVVLRMLVPLPPLAEQSRIVTRVEELMRLCDALEAKGQLEATQHVQLVSTLLATLTDSETPAQLADNWHRIATHFDLLLDRPEAVDALEQTILQLAVRGLLVPQDPQDEPAYKYLQKLCDGVERRQSKDAKHVQFQAEAEDLPTGWCMASVAAVAECLDFMRKPIKKDDRQVSGATVPYYGANGQVGWIEDFLFDEDLVLVVEDETFIGRTKPFSYIVRGKSWVNNHAHVLRPLAGMNVDYLNLCLQRYDFIPLTSGTTNRRKLTKAGLLDAQFMVAPLAEQSRIVARVASLRRLCTDLRQRLTVSQSTQAHLAEALVQNVT